MVIGKNLAFWLYCNMYTHLFSGYLARLLFIPSGESKAHIYESGMHCGGHWTCLFSWEEYEELEGDLKVHVVHQRDFTHFFQAAKQQCFLFCLWL